MALFFKYFLKKYNSDNIVFNLFKRYKQRTVFTKYLLKDKRFIIGDFTYGKPQIYDYGEKSILQIGKFCSIAPSVRIFLGGNHRMDWVTTYPFSALSTYFSKSKTVEILGHPASKGNVVIGNDVWIGYGATIMSGVTIGDGAVIGAMAVVAKDVKPYEIVVGNPAYPVKKRFDDEVIDKLLQLQWWNFPITEIEKMIPLLCSDPVHFFENHNL